MDYGICLPNFPDGASREGMEAAAETAEDTAETAAEAVGAHPPVATAEAYEP